MKLHIGCGEKFIPGFIHIDIRKFPHIDYVAQANNLYMFEDNSVDLIYSCHVLEHFKRTQTISVLQEWHRLLIKGGVLRIAVPDFEKLAEIYISTRKLDLVLGPIVGGQTYQENIHNMIFDYKYLSECLKKVGFTKVYRYDWRETIHKDYDDYSQAYIPHMDKINGILISLNLEAVK